MGDIVLWDYPKSSASYRVRIALGLAGLSYHSKVVDLLTAQHRTDAHLARNPQGLVPVLDIDGHRLTQSLAILEYLDETRQLGLLPVEPRLRAQVRALAYALAIDVHPVCNLSVAHHASQGKEPALTAWMKRHIRPGLDAFEALLPEDAPHPYSTAPVPSLADLCLIPQLYNARRWGVDFDDCPKIIAIEAACQVLPAFQKAHPDQLKAI
ncbi:MAG: maleylacetoacetate isomerase [Thalassovita sp.]